MDSSIIDNDSKAPAFNKFKRLSCKYYSQFSEISKVDKHLKQFLCF